MLLKRQSVKTYGTCRLLEGHYKPGDKVLIVDDVLMTGGTLIKDIAALEAEGLQVVASVVYLDRAQGGAKRTLNATNIPTYRVVNLPEAFQMLLKNKKVSQIQVDTTLKYLRDNRFDTEVKSS